MTSRQFVKQKDRLETYFRRFGLEGESAFGALVYHYVLCYADRMVSIPQAITKKWQAEHYRVEKDWHIIGFLDALVAQDPRGGRLAEWYQFFVGRRYREASGKFFTPKPIAAAMARMLPLLDSPVVMDPTCGGGTFLVEASHRWRKGPCTLIANDIDAALVELTAAVLSLSTPPQHTKCYSLADIFDPTPELAGWYGKVDYILANPPFSIRIDYQQFDSKLFSLGYRNSDALFIDTALQLLRPGGRLVCLLPHSIIANKEFSGLRAAVEESWLLLGIICLPEGAFHLAAGTTTRADIVVLQKKRQSDDEVKQAVFSSVPSVGVRLNNRATTLVTNKLEDILASSEVRKALGIAGGSSDG